jgi:hypothetical protein
VLIAVWLAAAWSATNGSGSSAARSRRRCRRVGRAAHRRGHDRGRAPAARRRRGCGGATGDLLRRGASTSLRLTYCGTGSADRLARPGRRAAAVRAGTGPAARAAGHADVARLFSQGGVLAGASPGSSYPSVGIRRMRITRKIIVLDAADLEAESSFWSALLGGKADAEGTRTPARLEPSLARRMQHAPAARAVVGRIEPAIHRLLRAGKFGVPEHRQAAEIGVRSPGRQASGPVARETSRLAHRRSSWTAPFRRGRPFGTELARVSRGVSYDSPSASASSPGAKSAG